MGLAYLLLLLALAVASAGLLVEGFAWLLAIALALLVIGFVRGYAIWTRT